jgi:3-oxoadipate enol-lactonase
MTDAPGLRQIDLGDVRLNVFERGDGPALLFVHGFPLDHTMWHGQLDHFATQFHVIAPDLRGFGASSSGPDVGSVRMEYFADDCARLLDALNVNTKVTFCGLSMGGYIAWQFARKYPQRLARLVLCDTRAAADTAAAAETRFKMAEHVLAAGTELVARAMLPKLFAQVTFARQPEVVAAVERTILQTQPAAIAAAQRGMAARPDVNAWLPQFQVPALVVVGVEDAISPVDEMRQIAAGLPHARLAIIPDAGHMAPLENPAVFNRELDEFLRAN